MKVRAAAAVTLALLLSVGVTDGAGVFLEVSPSTALPNGSLYVTRGSSVDFLCSSDAFPAQTLSWSVRDSAGDGNERGSGRSPLKFSINNVQPGDQGTYTCHAHDSLSNRTTSQSQELLVYYAPDRQPLCSWEPGAEALDVLLVCGWYGGYPLPTLDWHKLTGGADVTPQEGERITVHIRQFVLRDGDQLTCSASHVTGRRSSCSFTFREPYPTGQPLVTALLGSTITLSCSETHSLPPAQTVWKRRDTVLNNTHKYTLTDDRILYTLTILNISSEDQGFYYCYSQNPLGPKELPVYLTVRSSAENGGAIVGVFVSVLVVMLGIVVGVTLYSKRDRICIGLSLAEERGDVLSLIDSEDEEIFHDAVPRLPPLTNGHATTLVEIHRIPSSDHEDNSEHTLQ